MADMSLWIILSSIISIILILGAFAAGYLFGYHEGVGDKPKRWPR